MYSQAHSLTPGSDVAALTPPRGSKSIGVIVFNGFGLREMAQLVEAFQLANTLADQNGEAPGLWRVTLVSASGGRIASDSSAFVWTERLDDYSPSAEFDALFLVEGSGLPAALRDRRFINWSERADSNSERLTASVHSLQCLRAATRQTSWPQAAAGLRNNGSSGVNNPCIAAALQLIKANQGTAIAQLVESLLEQCNESPQPTASQQTVVRVPSDKIQASMRWMEAHWDEATATHEAAQVATMSQRNFLRRFKVETGQTPTEYLQDLRVTAICRWLSQTDLPVEHIAHQCGLGNSKRLARLLRNRLGVTPAQYRRERNAETRPNEVKVPGHATG